MNQTAIITVIIALVVAGGAYWYINTDDSDVITDEPQAQEAQDYNSSRGNRPQADQEPDTDVDVTIESEPAEGGDGPGATLEGQTATPGDPQEPKDDNSAQPADENPFGEVEVGSTQGEAKTSDNDATKVSDEEY